MNYLRINKYQLNQTLGTEHMRDDFINESDEETRVCCESDVEFEDQLEKFKERLEHISKEANKKKAKLVPNVSKDWIRELQKILNNQYGFLSPRGGSGPNQRDLLWLSKQQNSA